MFRLTRTQLLPIGLDIGHDCIKMLQLEVVGGKSLVVRALEREPLPPEAVAQPHLRMPLAVELIRGMLRRGGFAGRRAVVALPREVLHVKNFRLPQMPPADMESAAALEARHLFPFAVEEDFLRFLIAGEIRQGSETLQEVIVLATPRGQVADFVEQVHRCGIVIDAIDAEPCALFRAVDRFIRRRDDELEVQVLLDVGLAKTQVVIGKGREISFLKTLDIGGMHLNEAVSRKLNITVEEAQALRRRLAESSLSGPAEQRDPVRQAVTDAARATLEQLAREVSLCLRYQSVTFRGHRPTRLRLFGGQACDPQIQAVLSATLPIPIQPGRPLAGVDTGKVAPIDSQGGMPEWAVALGLALRRTTGAFGSPEGRPRSAGPPPVLPAEGELPPPPAAPPGEAMTRDARESEVLHA